MEPQKPREQFFAVWIKRVPDLFFSYLRLTFSGVFLLLFLHWLTRQPDDGQTINAYCRSLK